LIVRSMVDQKQSPEAIGAALGMKAYAVTSKLLPAAKRYTASRLTDQMNMLCELEIKVKGAAQSKRTLVELAVLSLAV